MDRPLPRRPFPATLDLLTGRLDPVPERLTRRTRIPYITARPVATMVLALLLGLACADTVPAKEGPYRVLILHSFRNSLPVNTDYYDGLVRGFSSAGDTIIEIDTEAPDLAGITGEEKADGLLRFFQNNYLKRKPQR